MTDTSVTKKHITAKWRDNTVSFAMGIGAAVYGAFAAPASVWIGLHSGQAVYEMTGDPILPAFVGFVAGLTTAATGYYATFSCFARIPKKAFGVAGFVASMAALCCVPDRVWDQFPVTRELNTLGKEIGQMNSRVELRTGAVDPSPKP